MAEVQKPSGFGALKLLAAMILLPLFGLIAWNWYIDHKIETTRSMAERVISTDPAMLGYPAQIDVTARGQSVTVSGLTPSMQAKQRVVEDLQRALPGVTLRDQLSVVAGSGIVVPDLTPEFQRVRNDVASSVDDLTHAAIVRAGTRADWRLKQATGDLARAIAIADALPQQEQAQQVAADLAAIASSNSALLQSLDKAGNAAPQASKFRALTARLDTAAEALLKLTGVREPPAVRDASQRSAGEPPLDVAVEQFAVAAERVAALSSSLAVATALRPAPQPIPPPPAPLPPEISPREKLDAFARANAIFFATNTEYRNPAKAAETLAALAQHIKAAGALVRVVGYTDEVGGQQRNNQLALDRAAKVRTELIALGIPENLLSSVGRANALDLSDTRGAQSPNRRVEFELGFEGEASQ